jgi:hypothetical protein
MVPFMFNLAILPERHDYRNRFILKFLVFENRLAKIEDGRGLLVILSILLQAFQAFQELFLP